MVQCPNAPFKLVLSERGDEHAIWKVALLAVNRELFQLIRTREDGEWLGLTKWINGQRDADEMQCWQIQDWAHIQGNNWRYL